MLQTLITPRPSFAWSNTLWTATTTAIGILYRAGNDQPYVMVFIRKWYKDIASARNVAPESKSKQHGALYHLQRHTYTTYLRHSLYFKSGFLHPILTRVCNHAPPTTLPESPVHSSSKPIRSSSFVSSPRHSYSSIHNRTYSGMPRCTHAAAELEKKRS